MSIAPKDSYSYKVTSVREASSGKITINGEEFDIGGAIDLSVPKVPLKIDLPQYVPQYPQYNGPFGYDPDPWRTLRNPPSEAEILERMRTQYEQLAREMDEFKRRNAPVVAPAQVETDDQAIARLRSVRRKMVTE